MIARARVWLSQWQLNPSVVPVLLAILGAMGMFAVLNPFPTSSVPIFLLIAVGLSLCLSRPRPAEDRNAVTSSHAIAVIVSIEGRFGPVLLGGEAHWLHRLALWTLITMAVIGGVELLHVFLRYLKGRFSHGAKKDTRA